MLDAIEDSEDDWEEVDVPDQHLEITINARPKNEKKKNTSHADRLVRTDCHKIHTVCLLANAWTRNRWINDPLLHARLLSLTPLSLQDAFALIHKSRVPDQNQRGRLFEAAISRLAEWWAQTYFHVEHSGHIRSRTFDDVQSLIADISPEALFDALEESDDAERIRSPNSLMKHALAGSGSRDVSAQLFTALCRALGIPARLVVSLQSVPWRAGVGKPKPKTVRKSKKELENGKGKEKDTGDDGEEGSNEMEGVAILPRDLKGKGKAKEDPFPGDGQSLDGRAMKPLKANTPPSVKLRKSKSKGHILGSSPTPRRQATPDPTTSAPVFWTEVFSRADTRWLPVDPVRSIVNKRKVFDPTPTAGPGAPDRNLRQENRMVYVVALEEDGYARDVTPRYAKDYGARVAKMQEVGGVGGRRKQWWERVVGVVRRPYRLLRDDVEDDELEVNQMMEGMPTSMAGFKDHPLYVLARHLKRDEVIHPLTELGKFRGEPVYARAAVLTLKSAENWLRGSGRVVKPGCQPMKWVKPRAATVGRRREIEVAAEKSRAAKGEAVGENADGAGGGEEVMQGLYALSQTELYKADPVVDGRIPKNDFGNIDLYVPSMLPKGAVHVPFKGTAKIARTLGFDYAEAVTGFEFKKRRAFPLIEGVVVAAEHENILLEAYLEAEQDAEERARLKKHARVIKLWTRLVQGLRIRQRLQKEYVDKPKPDTVLETDVVNDSRDDELLHGGGGGFLIGADDVVQPYHLPRYRYQPIETPSSPSTPAEPEQIDRAIASTSAASFMPEFRTYALETMEDDQDEYTSEDGVHLDARPVSLSVLANGIPKSMREMAADAEQRARCDSSEALDVDNEDEYHPGRPSSSTSPMATNGPITKSAANAKAASKSTVAKKRGRREEGDNSPAKRVKGSGTSSPSTPGSGRVLRPRASKSPAKIQQEKDLEEAFRRATKA